MCANLIGRAAGGTPVDISFCFNWAVIYIPCTAGFVPADTIADNPVAGLAPTDKQGPGSDNQGVAGVDTASGYF